MAVEGNRTVVQRFAQVWSAGNLDLVDELAEPGIVVTYPVLPEPVRGTVAFKELLGQFYTAFPDASVTVDELISEGDRVVARWSLRGTHRGDLLGIPPTGRRVAWTGITIYCLADGKVAEERGEEDALGLMRQLGVIPGSS